MTYSFKTPQPPRRLWRRTALAAVLMAGTALGGFAVGHAGFAATDATPGAPVNPPGSNPTGGQVLPDFTNLVEPGEAGRGLHHHNDADRGVRGRR